MVLPSQVWAAENITVTISAFEQVIESAATVPGTVSDYQAGTPAGDARALQFRTGVASTLNTSVDTVSGLNVSSGRRLLTSMEPADGARADTGRDYGRPRLPSWILTTRTGVLSAATGGLPEGRTSTPLAPRSTPVEIVPTTAAPGQDPEHVLSVQTASFERMNLTSLELRRNLSTLGPLTYEIQAQRPGKTKAVWTA